MTTYHRRLGWLTAIALLVTMPLTRPGAVSGAVSLPPGFSDTLFASGFGGRLTAMTFAPDGRLFVSEKQGSVRIVDGGRVVGDPFLTLSTATDSEKGLKSLAFDPDYASNGYVYVYYTDAQTLKNKVSRFTRTPGDPDHADPTTEKVLVSGIDSGIYHSGGALAFGSDGRLYISTGDASYAPYAQQLGNLNGKILRLNADGTIPANNPFVGQAGKRAEIWAYGLRNPFTFAFSAAGRLFINDVGEATWEELNEGARGANYGWPTCEGVCNDARFVDPIYAYRHSDGPGKSITGAAFYDGSMFPADYAGDYFFGDYVGNYIKRYDLASGQVSDFAANALNPVDLDVGPDGALYYLSVEAKTVHRIAYGDPTPPPPPADANAFRNPGFEQTGSAWLAPWRWVVRSPAQASIARDTAVKFAGNAALRATVTTASLDWHAQILQPNIPLAARREHTLTFAARAATSRSVRVAFSQNGGSYPIYFQRTLQITTAWQRYTVRFTPATDDPRSLFAINLGNAAGSVWFDAFALSASSVIGKPPVPSIAAPEIGTTFRAGQRIDFAGGATDAEDGTLGPNALRWEVVFHHDTHTHPFIEPFSGATSGSFTIPDTGETSSNVWYRIHLVATDSDGNATEATRDIRPITARVTLATQPAGLTLNLNGIPVSTPYSFTGVVGFRREIAAPLSQDLNGTTYDFVSWSDKGAATHTIATPDSATTYTALYQPRVSNELANAGFDAAGSGWRDPWQFAMRSPALAAFVRDTSNVATAPAALRVDVLKAAGARDVQVYQPGVPLLGGAQHRLTFSARSSIRRSVSITFTSQKTPFRVLYSHTIQLARGWHDYTITFTPAASRARTRFCFGLGASRGSVWIDDVVLRH